MKRIKQVFVLISIITFLIFIISCEKRDFKPVAKVETEKVSEIMATTAKAIGDIIDLGNGITDYGHCWSVSAVPSISSSKTFFGIVSKIGSYTSELSNLEPGETYYIRAYAKIKEGVIYGNTLKFTTLGPPSLTTTAATAITSSSATLGGYVSADGGAHVTDRGVYWRASSNPDTTWIKFPIGDGIGTFSNSLSGLTPNNIYYFKAYATNSVATAYGAKLWFTTLLSAPTNVSATAENTQATVIFTPPASNGGATITGYIVTSSPGDFTGTGSTSPITVTGLINGTAYTFTVVAVYATGNSLPSSASNSVTPSTIPDAPTNVSAIAGSAQATVIFSPPASNGGAAITEYTVTSSPGGFTGTGSASPITVTGLVNGTAYTFTVFATNGNGPGLVSSASNSVTPTCPLLSSALDNCGLICTTGGDSQWSPETDVTFYGVDADKSGRITDNQSTYLQTTLVGPGVLSFEWKVSSEANYDFLILYIDGVPQNQISGEVDWQQNVYTLGSGTHDIEWTYAKDVSVSLGSDCGWVDQVLYNRK